MNWNFAQNDYSADIINLQNLVLFFNDHMCDFVECGSRPD
jgi:hypothetical protein